MKRLPKFKSEEEEARFWETHSPLDYPDEFSEVKKGFGTPGFCAYGGLKAEF